MSDNSENMVSQHTVTELINELGKTNQAAIEGLERKNKETFEKASDDTEKILKELQVVQTEKKELSDQLLSLEKRVARGVKEYTDKNDPAMVKYYQHVDIELRKGMMGAKVMDADLFQNMAEIVASAKGINIKTVEESVDTQGGFFVHPDFVSAQVRRIFLTSPIRQFATIMNTTSNQVKLVINDEQGTASSYVAENTAIVTGDTPTIGQLTILAHKQKVSQDLTLEMIQDSSIDITQWIVDKTTARQARDQNTAFVNGTGNGEPRGILNYPAWPGITYTREALQHIDSGTDGEFTYDGLTNVWGALKPPYQADAIWMLNFRDWRKIVQIKDTQDRPLYNMTNLLQTGAPMVLLGKPVHFAEDVLATVDASPTTGNAIYGDVSGYTVLDRMGMTVFVDPFTQAARDVTRYFVTSRNGGALTNYESLKVMDAKA